MTDREQELANKFTPKHITENLPVDLDETKKEIRQTMVPQEKEPVIPPEVSLKGNREYTFWFDWTSPSGKNYQGEFTNRVLSLGDKSAAGVLRAKLAGGMPLASLDDITVEINLIISHLTFSLVKRPEWASGDLRELDELALLQAIYEEVVSHEATFLGYIKDQKGSNAKR